MMRAVRYLGAAKVEVVEVPVPVPGPGDVLVRVEVSAICGSEKAQLLAGSDVNAGHEAAGVIEVAPPGCGFSVGERVGVSAVLGCGGCRQCAHGVEVRCDAPRVQLGMHAELISVAPSTLRRLPAGFDAALAVLVSGDALGVPVRGVRRAPHDEGDRVVVLGLGPVGLAHVMVRSFLGADVVAVEPSAARRDLALELGASAVVAPGGDLQGPPPSLVIEASGRADSVAVAMATVAKGGTVLQSGECAMAEVSPSQIIAREITYVGSWFYASEDYDEILRLQAAGLAGQRLVTHEFAADYADAAYEAMLSTVSGKVLLRWSGDLSSSLLVG